VAKPIKINRSGFLRCIHTLFDSCLAQTIIASITMPPPAGASVGHEAVGKVTVADNTHMDMSQVIQAQQAAEAEKAMTLGQAMKHFHKGIMWSMLLSFALVMDGYDIVIVSRILMNRLRIDTLQINSFWGLPAFLNRFGQIDASGERYISANWQAGLNNANNVGNVIGLAVRNFSILRLNTKPRLSRNTYIGGMLFMIGAIFIVVFAKDMPMLFGGELVCGIAWGSE
jgi:SP family general alpha glucoside:H+ symporter-like MFS transporter